LASGFLGARIDTFCDNAGLPRKTVGNSAIGLAIGVDKSAKPVSVFKVDLVPVLLSFPHHVVVVTPVARLVPVFLHLPVFASPNVVLMRLSILLRFLFALILAIRVEVRAVFFSPPVEPLLSGLSRNI
jgi:hypothetical protein